MTGQDMIAHSFGIVGMAQVVECLPDKFEA
jgi:hypothetical protein